MSFAKLKKEVEIVQRAIKLKDKSKPQKTPFDYALVTCKEREISSTTHLFHDIAVRLGHGELRACQYRIPIEYDPNFNGEARVEAEKHATPEELRRIELEAEIYEKWTRLMLILTETEKDAIKQYNESSTEEARLYYEQIMAKYGDKSYEDFAMKPYLAGSGIPMDALRKMDSVFADALEMRGIKNHE
jgi:hypothetical protein